MPADKPKVTIYDVAEYAGVAISTVSRVLNNSPDVSEPTRAKVLKAIKTLQFRPDRTAKSLAQQQSTSLAVALPSFTTPYYNELLKGVRDALREHDIDLLLCDLGSQTKHTSLLNFLKRGAVDGLLLANTRIDEEIAQELKALRAPVVLLGIAYPGFDYYVWDNKAGAEQAVTHLIEQGHTKIAMLRARMDSISQGGRVEGYRTALEAAGIPFDQDLIYMGTTQKHSGFSEEAGYEAMQLLLADQKDVTAIFASSDVQAIGAWKAIRDAGYSVPEDFALIGFDNIKTSEYIGLSSIDQHMLSIGHEATVRLLDRVINGSPEDRIERHISPILRARNTTTQK